MAKCVFPTPGAPKMMAVRLRQKSARRELAHEPLINRRLESEIEIVQRFHRGEVRDFEAHRDAGPLLSLDFLAQDGIQKV